MSAVIRIAESAARAVTLAATAPVTTGHMCCPCGTESGPVRHAQGGKPWWASAAGHAGGYANIVPADGSSASF